MSSIVIAAFLLRRDRNNTFVLEKRHEQVGEKDVRVEGHIQRIRVGPIRRIRKIIIGGPVSYVEDTG